MPLQKSVYIPSTTCQKKKSPASVAVKMWWCKGWHHYPSYAPHVRVSLWSSCRGPCVVMLWPLLTHVSHLAHYFIKNKDLLVYQSCLSDACTHCRGNLSSPAVKQATFPRRHFDFCSIECRGKSWMKQCHSETACTTTEAAKSRNPAITPLIFVSDFNMFKYPRRESLNWKNDIQEFHPDFHFTQIWNIKKLRSS